MKNLHWLKVLSLRGPVLHQNSLEIDFIVVSDIEGSDIYQLLLVPWKNIVPSRNYRWSKVSAYV